jgi:predicted  nucleic acid-binding Zn-ribbon protein
MSDIISRAKAFLSGREPPPFYQELAEALVREHERVSDSVLEAKEAEIEALRKQVRDLKIALESAKKTADDRLRELGEVRSALASAKRTIDMWPI